MNNPHRPTFVREIYYGNTLPPGVEGPPDLDDDPNADVCLVDDPDDEHGDEE